MHHPGGYLLDNDKQKLGNQHLSIFIKTNYIECFFIYTYVFINLANQGMVCDAEFELMH